MTLPSTSEPSAPRPSVPRLLLGAVGVGLIGVGLFNLLSIGFVDVLWVGFWLGLGLVLHDGVLAPATAALSKLAADRWPADKRRGLLIALVSVGSLTLIALPLFGQQGAVAGNDSLLGRNYLVGWAVACLLVLLGAGVAEAVGRVRAKRASSPSTTSR